MARTPMALQSLSPWLHLTPTRHQPHRTRGAATGRQTTPSCLEALIFSTGFPNKDCIFPDNSI